MAQKLNDKDLVSFKELLMAPYWKAEEEARAAKREMWAQGDKYVSPREWRRVKRKN
jgi:endonuclease YncB( thermonuclease family)